MFYENKTPFYLMQALFDHSDSESILRFIEKYGFNNVVDRNSNTLLHLACSKGYINIVEFLITSGMNIHAFNNVKRTPLYLAVMHESPNSLVIVNKLLLNGANFSLKDKYGNTPLHLASSAKNHSITTLLIKNGADIYKKDYAGATPFHRSLDKDTLKSFINCGIDINCRDKDENTVLHLACYYSNNELISFLLFHQANINSQNKKGNTPLHVAYEKKRYDTIQFLLEHNADTSIKNNDNQSILDIAIKNHDCDITHLIETYKNYNDLNNSINNSTDIETVKKYKL